MVWREYNKVHVLFMSTRKINIKIQICTCVILKCWISTGRNKERVLYVLLFYPLLSNEKKPINPRHEASFRYACALDEVARMFKIYNGVEHIQWAHSLDKCVLVTIIPDWRTKEQEEGVPQGRHSGPRHVRTDKCC